MSVQARSQGQEGTLTKLLVALAPRFLVLILATLALAAPGRCAAPDPADIPYTVARLSERVIVLDCLDVHVTAIVGDSGIVVVDTNRSSGVMRRLRQVIEQEFGRDDFAYLINTHADRDHSSGNPAFPSVPLVAQENYAEYVRHAKAARLCLEWRTRSRLAEARARYAAADPRSREADSLRTRIASLEMVEADLRDRRPASVPAVTFKDSLNLDLGDLTLELHCYGEAHTNHDLVVYVPQEKLLLTGDLICSPQSPCFSVDALSDVPRLAAGLEGLLGRATGLETVVPGHGETLSRADLSGFCHALTDRYRQVRIETSAARILSRTIEREGIQAALKRCPPPAPSNPGTLDWSEGELATLGDRLLRRGKTAEAIAVLRLAVRALPESSLLYAGLGDACLEKDDREAAIAAYRKSLSLASYNRYAADMLRALGAEG